MPKHTTKNQAGGLALEEIYNMLMYDIEPELMTDMLPELAEIYAGETEEERAERGERYARAFETFTERFAQILDLWKEELLAFKEKALAAFKERSTKEDAKKLSDIEHSLENP